MSGRQKKKRNETHSAGSLEANLLDDRLQELNQGGSHVDQDLDHIGAHLGKDSNAARKQETHERGKMWRWQ